MEETVLESELKEDMLAIATLDVPPDAQKPVLLIRKEQQYWLVRDLANYTFWIWEKKLKPLG